MTEETKESLINIKRENYVTARTASGGKSLHNNDAVAQGLQGLNLEELYAIAGKFLAFPVKVKKESCDDLAALQGAYSNLNDGMQRMNLGNRIRAQVGKIDADNAKAAEKAKADGKEPKAAKSGADKLASVLSPFIKARAKREEEAEKAAQKAAEQKKAEKKDKESEKAA